MVIMIDLPDGFKAGSVDAREYFAKEFAQLKKRNPDLGFQLIPFSYSQMPGENNAHVISLMALTI